MTLSVSRCRDLAAIALLVAAVFLLYARTFGYGWNYDDFMVIVDNPDVRSWGEFWQDSYQGRPLRELTFLLDHALFGYEPRWWHLQNIFWHALNGMLVYWLLLRLDVGRLAAFLAAGFFLLHPLQVEVVASTSHRKDTLAVAASLGALLAYLQVYAGRRSWLWGGLALICYLLAISAKQTAVLLPALWLVYDRFFLPEDRRLLVRPCWTRCLPWGTAVAAAGFLLWVMLGGGLGLYLESAGYLLAKVQDFSEPSIGGYLRLLLTAWSFMALRIVWPANLAVEYLTPPAVGWGTPWVLAGLLLVLGGSIAFVVAWRRGLALPILAGCWMFLLWAPAANLFPFALAYPAADRYFYSVLLGVGILLAWGGERLCRSKGLLLAIGGVALFALFLVSWRQVPVWASEESVYLHALEVSPGNSFVLNELGKIAEKRGDAAGAMSYYRAAVEASPRNVAAHYNLGQLYERAGFMDRALEHYQLFLLDNSPDYQETARALAERLRRERGVIFKGRP